LNYSKIYNDLVEKAKVRGLDKNKIGFYTEAHHIVPVCIGGTNGANNFVLFSGREHFIAHMLLWKAHPDNVSLMRAAHIMSSRWTNDIAGNSHKGINSKVYSKLREEYSQAVSEQVSGENNPFYGKTHTEESLAKMKSWHANNPYHFAKVFAQKNNLSLEEAKFILLERKSNKGKYYFVDSLENWATNNKKYMMQFKPKVDELQPFIINIGSVFPSFRYKGELNDWLSFEVYKDFWLRSNKTGPKDFSTKIQKVSGREFSGTYFKTMIERFSEGFDPSSNPDFIVKALNNNSDKYISEVGMCLEKTLDDIEQEYISNWMKDRENNRSKIQQALDDLSVEKHKYNSKAKFSLVDVTEALILWRSGYVEQKFLAGLYGVARNSVSNALEVKERWLEVKNKIEEIEVRVL
jgi:hypothetical protein